LRGAVATALASCAFVAAAQQPDAGREANLVVNGGFEEPMILEGYYAHADALPGWTLAFGPAIEVQNRIAGAPFEGRQFVELDSSANSGIAQLLKTAPGASYALRFAYSPRPGVPAASNGLYVKWDDVVVARLARDGSRLAETQWKVYRYVVKARSAETRLEFGATGASDQLGAFLDAVSVTRLRPSARR
jgi:hypothetical protein